MSRKKPFYNPALDDLDLPTALTNEDKVSADGKQIEEMARVLDEARIDAHATIGSMNYGFGMWYAKAVYNAGYRKQSEGEWEKHIDEYDCEYAKCSCCGEEFYDASGEDTIDMFYNYCPNCGAKMKGV